MIQTSAAPLAVWWNRPRAVYVYFTIFAGANASAGHGRSLKGDGAMRNLVNEAMTVQYGGTKPGAGWRVETTRPATNAAPAGKWLGGLLGRRQPTTFHRCLAVHMHFATPRSALY